LITVAGMVDERFAGFGDLATAKSIVIDITKMTRMTSFGVRQWLNAMATLPKAVPIYLLGCPTFFVDQLNMVLNFGGPAKVLTVVAPYTCTSCGVESGETIDVLREGAGLVKGVVAHRECQRCGGLLEFDETLESYFAFLATYAATSLAPAAAELLAQRGYRPANLGDQSSVEKPPRIIKLVHGLVTYFRIIGSIGAMFRARPLLVGAEGEIVIDVADVDRVDAGGVKEWKRLIGTLVRQVPAVTIVDVGQAFLATVADSLTLAPNLAVASVLVPHRCVECDRVSQESVPATWPLVLAGGVCPMCGGQCTSTWSTGAPRELARVRMTPPPASAKVIEQRAEIVSRAMTDANVAQAGDNASAPIGADDTILGKYKIVRPLSAGGMAEVFLARQIGIGGFEKPVALKRIQHKLLHSRHMAVDMFLDEAKIAGRLMHPNIVQVLDVGEMQGALYLAMEYVRGKDLRDVLKKKGPIALAEACYVVREVAQALDYAYWSNDLMGKQLAVVHRDVSPQNIILGTDGSVKLLDFGVAMSAVTQHTRNTIVGKWLYMSPEAMTNRPVDHRSDLFSLGVVLYLSCTGTLPFTGREPAELVKKIRARQFAPLGERAAVPVELANLVARMISPDPNERPQRGQQVAAELAEIARRYNIESTGPRIAELLSAVFPGDFGAELPPGTAQELVISAYGNSIEQPKLASGSMPVQHARGSVPSVAPPSVTMHAVVPPPPPVVSALARPIAEAVDTGVTTFVEQITHSTVTKNKDDAPAPEPPSNKLSMVEIILAIAIVLALVAGMYVFVRPW